MAANDSTSDSPPSPPGHWLLGNLAALRTDVLGFLETVPRQHGDIVPLRFIGYRALLLSHPTWIEQVLVTDCQKYEKPPRFRRIVRRAFGNGLFASESAAWSAQRKRMQSALEQIDLESYLQSVVTVATRKLDRWDVGSTRQLEPMMVELSLAIRMCATFGTSDAESFAAIHTSLRTFMEYFASAIKHPLAPPLWVPTAKNRRIRTAMQRWWREIDVAIEEESAAKQAGPSCLIAYLRNAAPGYSAIASGELRDHAATWLLTGTETTANTLCWTWYLLATHHHVREKLLAEVGQTLRGKLPALGDTEKLPYTEAILLEAMRLYPQAYIIGRKAVAPFTMDGYRFSKGTTVVLNQWFIGRDPRWFESPLEFKPERWLSHDNRHPRFAYFPFGGGPRTCAGRRLAMLELPLILAAIAQRFDFRLAKDRTNAVPQPSLTLRSDPCVEVVLAKCKT